MLLKLHGDLNHPDRMIITEHDYDIFIDQNPLLCTYLASILISQTAVLIGYSLDDPDFRQIWSVLANRLGPSRKKAYAILVGAQPTHIAKYDRRNVRVINLSDDGSSYDEILAQAFKELGKLKLSRQVSPKEVKNEEALQELALPIGTKNKLCYFAVPPVLISYYRQQLYPEVRRLGLVPVSIDDFITPNDSVLSTMDTVVRRATFFVIDVSQPHTESELGLVTRKRKGVPLLMITESPNEAHTDVSGITTVQRPKPSEPNNELFITQFKVWLSSAIQTPLPTVQDESFRLLELQEYRAAVVTAVSRLEAELRKSSQRAMPKEFPPLGAAGLVHEAARKKIITPVDLEMLLGWIRLRNEVVHSFLRVEASEAKDVVSGIDEIILRLRNQESISNDKNHDFTPPNQTG